MHPFHEGVRSLVPSLARKVAVLCAVLAAVFGSLPRSQAQTTAFTLYGGPQSVAITAGTTQWLDVVVTPVSGSGFTGTVCVTVNPTGLPTGITFGTPTNSPNTCSPAGSFQVTAGVVSQLPVIAASSQTEWLGQFSLSAAATGYTTQTANVELTVSPTSGTLPTDYVLTTGVPAITLVPSGGIASYKFEVNAASANANAFTAGISGTVTGLPANVTATPASFSLTPGTPTDVTITAATGAALGNTVFTVGTSSTPTGSPTIVHNMPVVLNIGSQAQNFLLSTPAGMTVTSGANTTAYIGVSSVNGFNGKVTLTPGSLPAGVTNAVITPNTIWPNSLTPDTGNQYQSLVTLTLTGGSISTAAMESITVTGTTVGLSTPVTSTIPVYTSPTASSTVAINVPTTSFSATGTSPFPNRFIGFSISPVPFTAFTASNAVGNFANLMTNFATYVGLPLVRTNLDTSPGSVAALENAVNAVNSSYNQNFFFIEPSAFVLLTDQSEASTMITKVGGASQFFGVELDNEPDGYPGPAPDGITGAASLRPASWTFADYLNEVMSYKNDNLTGPYLVGAWAGSYWIPGLPALVTQFGTGSGAMTDFTLHRYAGCLTPDQLLFDEYSHNWYYDRFAGPLQTLPATLPVRAGEMNTSQCSTVSGGGNASGDTFAESLWLIDTAFELNAAGLPYSGTPPAPAVAGFNVHSNGTVDQYGNYNGPAFYDIAGVTPSSGALAVRPPYYGAYFLARAIQNGAKPLPLTNSDITQLSSGNVKVWATIDVSGNIRVVVLEKDDDSGSKTINLSMGSSNPGAAQLLTMKSSGGVSGLNPTIQIGSSGGTWGSFNSNGLISPTPSTSTVNPSYNSLTGAYYYSFQVDDGTASLLKILAP